LDLVHWAVIDSMRCVRFLFESSLSVGGDDGGMRINLSLKKINCVFVGADVTFVAVNLVIKAFDFLFKVI